MEETVLVAPAVLPKTKPRSPLQEFASRTVQVKSVAPSVSLVDAFHTPNRLDQRETENHVVKILINPQNDHANKIVVNSSDDCEKPTDSCVICEVAPCIRIRRNSDAEMVRKNNTMSDKVHEVSNNYFYYGTFNFGVMSNGQISPSDTLDSGTCSDMDGTPLPPPKRRNGVSVTLIGSHKRVPSSSSGIGVDSDDNESNISCDSLNSGNISPISNATTTSAKSTLLPQTLLQDIRRRSTHLKIDEKSYEERKIEEQEKDDRVIDPDMFYKFHINEKEDDSAVPVSSVIENETFAGYRNILDDGSATIRSAKGTIRGVKNRVRAGIATFLQMNNIAGKNYKEKEAGLVVVYTTTMGVLRETYQACMKVKQIMRTLLIKYEERDVFMSNEYQSEIRERMHCDHILVPQVFVDGQHVGDAETIERLNETGELRRILKPYKSMDVSTTCRVCGGYRLLPCQICKGSKKSVHRNHFTAEFVALKCMNCDEVGLVRCSSCS